MRQLETATLDGAARFYAGEMMQPDRKSGAGNFVGGPGLVKQDLYNFTYKDEFDYIVKNMKGWLGKAALTEFEAMVKEFAPREDKVYAAMLKEKLAIDPDGKHIPGCIGTVELGNRFIGTRTKVIKTRSWGELMIQKNVYQPVYAGEPEERKAGNKNLKELPEGADPWPVEVYQMTAPTISAEAAIAMADALTARIDEGSTAATIRGRTGTKPVDPDATESGTLLFTLTMSDPSFGAGADAAPGGRITANAITNDTSADATNTLTYCRIGATGTGADDHVDGDAGTSAADFIFNTTSIVSGAVVSMSSLTITQSQGSGAT